MTDAMLAIIRNRHSVTFRRTVSALPFKPFCMENLLFTFEIGRLQNFFLFPLLLRKLLYLLDDVIASVDG